MNPSVVVAAIPSPDQSVWQFGPIPLRAYAICILVGIFVAIWVADRRWVARGGRAGLAYDVAMWAVPFGIIGGRIYHVLTDWPTYFGDGGSGLAGAVAIWKGGLGIWGAIALGAVGAWIGCRRAGVPLPPFADALAVGLPLGQAIGRFGNWFNQELFGRPTDLPWGLQIDPENRPAGFEQFETFHPTFLYEAGGAAAHRPGDPGGRHPPERLHGHRRGTGGAGLPDRERAAAPRAGGSRRPGREGRDGAAGPCRRLSTRLMGQQSL